MRIRALVIFAVAAAALAFAEAAPAASTFYYQNKVYKGLNHSPFQQNGASNSGAFHLETFEDGLVNTFGLSVNRGKVLGKGLFTDSVDKDDGKNDGLGRKGRSFSSKKFKSIVFNFSSDSSGLGPTLAGLVVTDAAKNSTIKFHAWDSEGNLIGKIVKKFGDISRKGTTKDDRFFGVANSQGISKIRIFVNNKKGFEVDHVQYAYGFAVVPLPSPVLLGLTGIAIAGLARRRLWRRLGG